MKITTKNPPGKVKALILSLLGAELYDAVEGRGSGESIPVSHDAVLKLSAVWACVRLIAESIATLPLSMYENTTAGKRVASQHPLHFVIHDQPNPDSTASVFWEAVVASMLLRGRAPVEKLMLGDRLVGLSFLHPDRLTSRINRDGLRTLVYREDDGTTREIPKSRLWVIPGFSLDGKTGVSVIKYGAGVFGAALSAEASAKNTFDKGLQPTVAFKYPQVMTKDQREDARDALSRISGTVNAGKPVILEGGTDAMTIGINPNDAQLLESRAFGVEEVCRWFRVPPFMVGHSEKSTSWGSGIEQQMIGFLTFTLGPWIRRIEQSISKDLVMPGQRSRFYPKFAVEGFLRADSAARAAFYSVMVNNGIMTRDEVRELEDRVPMGGNAAVLTVQTALAPLDQIGNMTDATAARAALRNWLTEPSTPEQG